MGGVGCSIKPAGEVPWAFEARELRVARGRWGVDGSEDEGAAAGDAPVFAGEAPGFAAGLGGRVADAAVARVFAGPFDVPGLVHGGGEEGLGGDHQVEVGAEVYEEEAVVVVLAEVAEDEGAVREDGAVDVTAALVVCSIVITVRPSLSDINCTV